MPSRTDELMSKGMGVAKEAKAMFKGLHGVFKTLMEQHGEVSVLLRRCKSDPTRCDELWPKIRAELLSHERGEVQTLYPVLREYDEIRELADRHDREANDLEAKIQDLDVLPVASIEWNREFDELVKLVDDHVSLEESEIFPKAEEAIGEERANELDSKFLAARQSIIATA